MVKLYGDSPSYAEIRLQKLRESNQIDLTNDIDDEPEYLKSLREHYELQDQLGIESINKDAHSMFKHYLLEDILGYCINDIVLAPVLEAQHTDERGMYVGQSLVNNFIKETGVYDILDRFKYQNIYLAEIAQLTDKIHTTIMNEVTTKIKEGLPEKDAYDIEENSIKSYIKQSDCKMPKAIDGIIVNRVQASINKFIDDKKDAQFKIKQIYDKAKQKIDDYNAMQQDMGFGDQTDGFGSDGQDPDVTADNNFNAKMDAQQMGDNVSAANPGGMNVQEQYLAEAKDAEYDILNSHYNIFDAMMRIVMEATYKNAALKESYSLDNKINFDKIFNDVKVMYTFLECANTLNMIDVDAQYLRQMLRDMQESTDSDSDPEINKMLKDAKNEKPGSGEALFGGKQGAQQVEKTMNNSDKQSSSGNTKD